MTYRVACIGEPLAEISNGPQGMQIAFGGDTLNTAIYLARETTDQDIQVDYVTVLGEDAASEGVLDLMQREGISTEYVRRHPSRNMGIYALQNDANGERRFHYWRDRAAARLLFDQEDRLEALAIASANLVYLSGVTLAIMSEEGRVRLFNTLKSKRSNNRKIAFDSNFRTSLWEDTETARRWVKAFWEITDIGLPTIEDEIALFDDVSHQVLIERLNRIGVKQGALKMGAAGPVPLSGASYETQYPAADVVKDTTGAGDSFNGGFLAAYIKGDAESSCLSSAHEIAREVIGHKGAILPFNAPNELLRVGSTIRLRPENAQRYIELHADVWPGVLDRIKASNISNYSIFLKEPEHLMFAYFEYTGTDLKTDMAAIAADPTTQKWWAVCGPMQDPFETRKDGEWWAEMKQVFSMK
ncbi:PfkB family carbohydrate kinase [Epibacterium ulvae]|uniref:PfkB family carbohydrate kinase n=1 Tax=Epibacterium ulvae TaxID=1156985 RepID=UPI002490F97B|nr:PfkB family carbohydrate kinase [Epibacterium ulvae]